MARPNKKFYAVVRDHYSPAIFTSWAIACAFTDGYKNNKHKGFKRLEEAKAYMEENDIAKYKIFASCGELNPEILVGCRYYYAVASGREKGIYECFQNEAKEKVDKYPHACHKRFRTLEEAQEFIAEYEAARRGVDEQVIWQSHALEDMLQGLNLG